MWSWSPPATRRRCNGSGLRLWGQRSRNSFEIPAGTTVGIVGPSGAGKSTLLALLLRLYDPQEGSVEVDGVNLKKLNLTDYHHQIGPVLQADLDRLAGADIPVDIVFEQGLDVLGLAP